MLEFIANGRKIFIGDVIQIYFLMFDNYSLSSQYDEVLDER